MDTDSTLAAARAFARNLNILLKMARLYGFDHERTASLFDAAWSELRAALHQAGEAGILLGVSGSLVLLDGVPLEPKPTDRSFAQLLSSTGLSSVHFSPRVTSDDFLAFARGLATRDPKAGPVAVRLKAALAEKGEPTIRVNEVRFVAQDAALTDASLTAQVAMRALGPEADRLAEWLKDPQKFLQLMAAAEAARRQPAVPGSAAAPAEVVAPAAQETEEDAMSVIHFLSELGKASGEPNSTLETGGVREQLNQLPAGAQVTLSEALARLAASPAAQPDTPLLLQLAEQVAIRFALERYTRGDTQINAVIEMLDRMKREIKSLRQVLQVHENKMGQAGLEMEPHADILDRQFWAALPERAKLKILTSPEAWAIPPRNVRQFVEERLARSEVELVRSILENYSTGIENPAPQARRKTALGLMDLVDLYAHADGSLLESVLRRLGEGLPRESEAELQTLLGASFVRFSHEATARHDFPALRQAFDSLDRVEQQQPALAKLIGPRISVENRLPQLIEEAVREPHLPEALVEVLRRTPRAAAGQASGRMARCTRRDELERLVTLVGVLGEDALEQLRDTFASRPPPEAATTLALLSRLDTPTVEARLPARLRQWDRLQHDQAVYQLAAGGAPHRGKLLLSLLDVLDPTVLPEALDEIGLSGDNTAGGRLTNFLELADPFLRLKAIEALGRLRHAKAASILRTMVEAKQLWRWRHPRELRITAAQALGKIDPEWATECLPASGLHESELKLAPLDRDPQAPWIRQRRYQRIPLPRTLTAVLRSPQGDWRMSIEGMSLGGGVATCQRYVRPGTLTSIEFRPGLARLRAEVVVRDVRPQKLSFELVRINFEDRFKLRHPLATGVHQVGEGVTEDTARSVH